MRWIRLGTPVGVALTVALVAPVLPAGASHGTDTEVTVGSIDQGFSRNKQNEPSVAVNPIDESIVAAGANDNIDMELCNAGEDNTCPFTPDVGGSGVQFSTDGGATWSQPTYTGISARNCLGVPGDADPECDPQEGGPIGTLPKYDDEGVVSDGDPALAWGPVPSGGTFSWSNGERLYYTNLTADVVADPEEPFKGFEAIYVSWTDDPEAAAAGSEAAWHEPVLVTKQSAATFSDKEQIWADNAATSPFFGNAYICVADFRGTGAAQPIIVARSTNGGLTWSERQVSNATNNLQHFGKSGCTIRTDSEGVVYVFYEDFGQFATEQPIGQIEVVKSFDGGRKWTRPEVVTDVVQPGVFDPVLGRPVMDGLAGARVDLAAAPSADIANGAPTGTGATNDIVLTWADAADGLNDEHAMFSYGNYQGDGEFEWSDPAAVESEPDDRPVYTAAAISPDSRDVYLVYNAFLDPFRDDDFTSPRRLVGVVLHADVSPAGVTGPFTEVNRGHEGDARGSSQNDLTAEFLGDYVYVDATNDAAVAVWNDVREATVCTAIQDFRASLYTDDPDDPPAVQQVCPATFGNSDIWGGRYTDPSAP